MYQKEPLVSILIPVYNRENIITETINNALLQTYKNIEIIISDNNSSDNTIAVIKEIAKDEPKIRLLESKDNLGPVLNWIKCVENAKGLYSKILWSDDKMSPNFITESITLFDQNTAFVISPVEIFDDKSGKLLQKSFYQINKEYSKEEYLENFLIQNKLSFFGSPGCGIFRTTDLNKAIFVNIPNKLNLDFNIYGAGNDLLIFLNIANKYKKIKVATNTMSYFRSHPQSITIEKKKELNIYYEYSKHFFIKKYYPILQSKYKAKLFVLSLLDSSFKIIYDSIYFKLSFSKVLKYLGFQIIHFISRKR